MKINTPEKIVIGMLLSSLLALGGCAHNSAPSMSDLKPESIVYFKDTRTGICYAAMNSLDGDSGWYTTTITYVPCTPEVGRMIK
jgi:hypothetical protein